MIYHPVQPYQLGEYTVFGELGSGLAGVVYVARQRADGPLVALKLLRPDAEALVREHFWAEQGLLRKSAHPGLPRFVEGGQLAGRPFLASRLVEGTRLDAFGERRWPPAAAASLIAGLAAALDHLHVHHPDAPVVHADVGPHNIVVGDDGLPVLLDLGGAQTWLFRPAEQASLLTQAYCAPEQLEHRHLPASDQFALAALAFELLAGQPLRQAHSADDAWTTYALGARLPRRMQATAGVLARALQRDPRDRYGSCGTFALQLHTALRADRHLGHTTGADVQQVLRRQRSRQRRARFISVLGLLLVCLLATWGLYAATRSIPLARSPATVPSPAARPLPTATLAPAVRLATTTTPATPTAVPPTTVPPAAPPPVTPAPRVPARASPVALARVRAAPGAVMPELGGMQVTSARVQLALRGWSWERTLVRAAGAGQNLPSGTVVATLPPAGENMPIDGSIVLLVQR